MWFTPTLIIVIVNLINIPHNSYGIHNYAVAWKDPAEINPITNALM